MAKFGKPDSQSQCQQVVEVLVFLISRWSFFSTTKSHNGARSEAKMLIALLDHTCQKKRDGDRCHWTVIGYKAVHKERCSCLYFILSNSGKLQSSKCERLANL